MIKKAFEVINDDGRNGYVVSVWDSRNQAEDECRRLQMLASSSRVHFRIREKKTKDTD